MSFREAFYSLATSDLAGEFAGTIGQRIYPGIAPAGVARPFCVYSVTNAKRHIHLAGETGEGQAVIQLDIWGDTTEDVVGVKEKFRLALDGIQEFRSGTAVLHTVGIEPDESDLFLPPESGEEQPLFGVRISVSIQFGEMR